VAFQFYVSDAKPADLIYLGLGQPKRFLKNGCFDLVLTGINHGENIGMDVFHSGTVGMAMLASTFFETTAVAFSQQGNEKTMSSRQLKARSAFIIGFLKSEPKSAAKCWNVNFPAMDPVGWKICSVANHSRFRPFKAEKRKHEGCDVVELERGFIVVSPLCLNVGYPANRSSRTTMNSLHWACEKDRVCLVPLGKRGQVNQFP
jgi:5'/3'-nucleotidase SurE